MLSDKLKVLESSVASLEQISAVVTIAGPVKDHAAKARDELRNIVNSDGFASVDEEVKAAIVTVCNAFETLCRGLEEECVAPLFGYGEQPKPEP